MPEGIFGSAQPRWTPAWGLLTWSAPPAAILEVGSCREGEGARAGRDQAWGAERWSASMGAPASGLVCDGGGRRGQVPSWTEAGGLRGRTATTGRRGGLPLRKMGFSGSCPLLSSYSVQVPGDL